MTFIRFELPFEDDIGLITCIVITVFVSLIAQRKAWVQAHDGIRAKAVYE